MGSHISNQGPDGREYRKPTLKELRKLKAIQQLMDKSKEQQDEYLDDLSHVNESRAGWSQNITRSIFLEVFWFLIYLLSLIIVSILLVLLLEPLMQLGTWLTALIDRGSMSSADNVVEIDHYIQRFEPFSDKIGNGIIGGFAYFLFFFFWRLIKGRWIHQER